MRCDGCPDGMPKADSKEPWLCTQCTYDHPDPATDPFYQDQVKTLMYFCAVILVLVSAAEYDHCEASVI